MTRETRTPADLLHRTSLIEGTRVTLAMPFGTGAAAA
jgi:hypothetical protein